MSDAALACHDLACIRGGRLLFERLTIALAAGEAALVTGPNGAGKSSLLRIVAGLRVPAAGHVACLGRVALAGDAPALDAMRPLGEALAFWAALDGGDPAVGLEAMALAHLAEVPVRMLSTGQRRRADLARMIASGAPIWLLDEPASGLDAAAVTRLECVIAAHRASGGIVMATTHQPFALPDAHAVTLG